MRTIFFHVFIWGLKLHQFQDTKVPLATAAPLLAACASGGRGGGGFQTGLLATQSEENILHFGPIKYSHNWRKNG